MRNLLAGLALVAVVALGVWWYMSNQNNNSPTSNTSAQNSATNSADTSVNPTAAATIVYNGSGFSPSSVTIKSGDTVAIKNSSNTSLEFNSDPHPIHTNNSELNIGLVPPGETMTFKLTRAGTWGYHNHQNSSQTGRIVVTP